MAAAAPVPGQPHAEPQPARGAWLVLAMLCFVYVLNFLDRQLLSILAKPIQDELGVTDGQLGLISGLYFALFYCTLAIPVGWLADKTNRVKVLAWSCGLWSAATAACGMATSYPQLVLARISVGIGEAGGVPPSYAIISDYFPPQQRGTALGLYNLGPPIGQAMGVAFGASVAAAYGWREAFISIGVIGIVTALMVYLFVREPVRGGMDVAARAQADTPVPAAEAAAEPEPPALFWATFRSFFARPVLGLVALASGVTQIITYALLTFATVFLMREKGITLEEIAIWYAIVVGVGMCAGIYGAGWLVDKLAPRSRKAYAYIPAVGLTIAAPFFAAFVWAPGWELALLLLVVPMALNYAYLSPAVALVQAEVRPNQRVLSGALLLLVMNLIGLGLGPTYLGAMSDYFRADYPDNSLQMALYTLLPFYAVAVLLFLLLARAIGREQKGGSPS